MDSGQAQSAGGSGGSAGTSAGGNAQSQSRQAANPPNPGPGNQTVSSPPSVGLPGTPQVGVPGYWCQQPYLMAGPPPGPYPPQPVQAQWTPGPGGAWSMQQNACIVGVPESQPGGSSTAAGPSGCQAQGQVSKGPWNPKPVGAGEPSQTGPFAEVEDECGNCYMNFLNMFIMQGCFHQPFCSKCVRDASRQASVLRCPHCKRNSEGTIPIVRMKAVQQ